MNSKENRDLPCDLNILKSDIISRTGIALLLINAENKITLVNDNLLKLLGYSEDELLHNPLWPVILPEDCDYIKNQFEKIFSGQHSQVHFVIRALKKDHVQIALGIQAVLMPVSANDYQCFLLVNDISSWKNIQKTQIEAEFRFSDLVESIMEGIGIVDNNEVIIYCNPAFVRIFEENSEADIIGKRLLDYLSESQSNLVLEQTNLRRQNIVSQYELEITTAKQNKKVIITSISPRFDRQGKYVGAFGAIYDISDRKLIENELKLAHDVLEERVHQRTRQLADANEELRVEREALHQKTIALKEILSQIEGEKKKTASNMQANMDRIVLPIINRLKENQAIVNSPLITLLEDSLQEIASHFLDRIESRFPSLTPREVEICNMIKYGYSTKEIARTLHRSEHTVLKQRKTIRKKLKISNQNINLASYLKRIEFKK